MILQFLIKLAIKPNSSQNSIIGLKGNRLLIAIKAEAKDDKANKMLLDYFSKYIHLNIKNLKIIKGTKTANKTLSILCDQAKADAINKQLEIFSQIVPLLHSDKTFN